VFDVAIIGCGIVGAALAFELSQYDLSVAVLEKENDVSCGASRANSGILHAGYDPQPGTLMAKLNVEGSILSEKLCRELGVVYGHCGSLVLAFSEKEMQTAAELYERGVQNGVKGLEIWDAETTKNREPGISEKVAGALYAPSAAVVIPWEYTLALAETAVCNGVDIRLESAVTGIEKMVDGYRLQTQTGNVEARYVVNAAGLYADEIHNMISAAAFRIIPERGEYYLLDKKMVNMVRHVLFQCPTAAGKGVLIAPTTHGNVIIGPNNEQIDSRDDVATTGQGLETVRNHAQKSVPHLPLNENIRNFSGIRASSDQNDFIIAEAKDAPGFFDLAGIKSPGLTAAPAIAKMAVELLEGAGLKLKEKPKFLPRPKRTHFTELRQDEKRALIENRPEFGHMICRCERVTEGEILEALHAPIPPRSVDAIKRRCNAGLGRCQGGFCAPRVVELLARELKISPLEVLQDTAGSYILSSETKEGSCHE